MVVPTHSWAVSSTWTVVDVIRGRAECGALWSTSAAKKCRLSSGLIERRRERYCAGLSSVGEVEIRNVLEDGVSRPIYLFWALSSGLGFASVSQTAGLRVSSVSFDHDPEAAR